MKRAVQLFLVVSPKGRLCPSGAVGTGRFLKQGMPQYGQERHLFFFRGKNKNKKQKNPKNPFVVLILCMLPEKLGSL